MYPIVESLPWAILGACKKLCRNECRKTRQKKRGPTPAWPNKGAHHVETELDLYSRGGWFRTPAAGGGRHQHPARLDWNSLGLHWSTSNHSVFPILPPNNTVEPHFVVGGKRLSNTHDYTVTLQVVADPRGSLISPLRGNGCPSHLPRLCATVPVDFGMSSSALRLTNNLPQGMTFAVPNPGARVNLGDGQFTHLQKL